MSKETLDFVTHLAAEKLQNFFGVFLQFQIGVDSNVCLGAIRVDEQQAKLDELEKLVKEVEERNGH